MVMADYWKSNPRKFCDFCKCWFADNKASIEFHERGKRHQEAVRNRLDDIARRGREQYDQEKTTEKDMAKIEKAALKAVERDRKRLAASGGGGGEKEGSSTQIPTAAAIPAVRVSGPQLPGGAGVTSEQQKAGTLWCEALSDEGYQYYWNTQTGESRWEPPDEGFYSVDQQKSQGSATETAETAPTRQTNTDTKDSAAAMYTQKAKVVFRKRTEQKLGAGMLEFKKRKFGP